MIWDIQHACFCEGVAVEAVCGGMVWYGVAVCDIDVILCFLLVIL